DLGAIRDVRLVLEVPREGVGRSVVLAELAETLRDVEEQPGLRVELVRLAERRERVVPLALLVERLALLVERDRLLLLRRRLHRCSDEDRDGDGGGGEELHGVETTIGVRTTPAYGFFFLNGFTSAPSCALCVSSVVVGGVGVGVDVVVGCGRETCGFDTCT